MWRTLVALVAAAVTLAACGYVDRYEEQVYDWDPVYCYESIGKVQCYREPYHRDQRRLVNYYGPHPSRYDAPPPPDRAELQPPEMIDTWVKDPEPAVEAAKPLTYDDVFRKRAALKPLPPGTTTPGTSALLRNVEKQLTVPPQPLELGPPSPRPAPAKPVEAAPAE